MAKDPRGSTELQGHWHVLSGNSEDHLNGQYEGSKRSLNAFVANVRDILVGGLAFKALDGFEPTIRFSNCVSMKIPTFHFQRIDMKVRHEHVARGYNWLRLVPWIRPSAYGKLITTAGRKLELLITIGKTHKVA